MIGLDLEAERAQQPDATHTEHDLLFQSVSLVTAVELIGQALVLGRVLVEIGVQEQHRHLIPGTSLELVEPRPHPDFARLDLDHDLGAERRRPESRVPGVSQIDLATLAADLLA